MSAATATTYLLNRFRHRAGVVDRCPWLRRDPLAAAAGTREQLLTGQLLAGVLPAAQGTAGGDLQGANHAPTLLSAVSSSRGPVEQAGEFTERPRSGILGVVHPHLSPAKLALLSPGRSRGAI